MEMDQFASYIALTRLIIISIFWCSSSSSSNAADTRAATGSVAAAAETAAAAAMQPAQQQQENLYEQWQGQRQVRDSKHLRGSLAACMTWAFMRCANLEVPTTPLVGGGIMKGCSACERSCCSCNLAKLLAPNALHESWHVMSSCSTMTGFCLAPVVRLGVGPLIEAVSC